MTLAQLRYVIMVADCGSLNKAAEKFFVSQPSLSVALKELESEIGIEIFKRTNTGMTVRPEGEEFIGYARQVVEQYGLIETKFIDKSNQRKKFSVSMQHYSFAVEAFTNMVKKFDTDEYELAVCETKTHAVIENVKNSKSEIGILYLNDFNREVLEKVFQECGLEFHKLLECGIYVYMSKNHPLAGKKEIEIEELENYPCLSFEQGISNSFHFVEEILSTYHYRQLIRINDRATLLNLMANLNGYTLCPGIISRELSGDGYCIVKLNFSESITIGYISRKDAEMSELGKMYLKEVKSCVRELSPR